MKFFPRTLAVFCLMASALTLSAETVASAAAAESLFIDYVTYSPNDITVPTKLDTENLAYLNSTGRGLKADATSFLARLNPEHWMAMTRKTGGWLLQIHDETNEYNFRALVSTSGTVRVEKGVDWKGMSRLDDAAHAVEMAEGYLQRVRTSRTVFLETPMMGAATTAAAHSAAPASDAHGATAPAATATTHSASASDDQWQRLVDGNLRFVNGTVTRPNQTMLRVAETAKGQKPFAVVVTCSDSRVPPELLFDQGFGDLFVVRTAGEVVTEVELGSIEYAVEHLGAQFIVVLGHERCGAVDATVKGGELPHNIEAIAEQIRPAVESARFFKGDILDNAVRENAKLVLKKIKGSEILAEFFREGHLNFKAAYYDLDTGKVSAL